MKKIISLILSFAMMLTLIVTVGAADDTTAILTVKQDGVVIQPDADGLINVKAGTEFDVFLSFANSPNYKTVGFQVKHDNDYVEYNADDTKTKWLIDGGFVTIIDDETYTGGYTSFSDVDVNKEVAVVNFKALDVTEKTVISVETKLGQNNDWSQITTLNIKVLGENFTNPTLQLDGAAVADRTYDGQTHTLSVAGLTDAEKENATVSITVNDSAYAADTVKNAGKYAVKAVITKPGYNTVTLEDTFTINPAPVTIEGLAAEDKVYDGNTDAVIDSASAEVSGAFEDIAVVYPETGIFATKDAGENIAVAIDDITIEDANYILTAQPVLTATIEKKEIAVKADNITMTVGRDEPALTYQYDANDIVDGAEFTGALEREPGTEVGKEYVITQGTLALTDNYNIVFTNGIFKIVDKDYTKIEITKAPKTEYIEDQQFDPTGMEVTATYLLADGVTTDTEVVTGYTYSPEVLKLNDTVVTIDFAGFKADVAVTVTEKVLEELILDTTGINLAPVEGTKFDYSALKVQGKYNNGKTYDLESADYNVVLPEGMLDADGNLVVGTYEVTVASGTVKATFTVDVAAKSLTGITVTNVPTKVNYVEGQAFDVFGMTVVAEYDNGQTAEIYVKTQDNPNGYTVSPNGALSPNVKYVTISYSENGITKEATVDITVAAKAVDSIAVSEDSFLQKTEYVEGNAFDPTGLIIDVTYNDGTTTKFTEINVIPDFTYTPNPLTVGTEEVTISYQGKTAIVSGITVKARTLKSLTVASYVPEYVDGTSFDKNTTVVKAVYDNGAEENFTGYTVSPAEFKLAYPAVAEDVEVVISYTKDDVTIAADPIIITVVPCVAVNNDTGVRYDDLGEALTDAEEGETVVVQLDTVITEDVEIGADVTLDINGKTVTTADGVTINTGSNTLVVDNTDGAADAVLSINGTETTITAGESVEVTEEEETPDNSGNATEAIVYALNYYEHFVFEIEIIESENGTIKGRKNPTLGETPTFTITPDEGYVVADVLVDGKSVGAVTKYKFDKIRGDHEITAVFEEVE